MKVLIILMLAIVYASGEDENKKTRCMFTQSDCASFGPEVLGINGNLYELDIPVSWAREITPEDCCLSCQSFGATSFGLYVFESTYYTSGVGNNIWYYLEYQVCRCYSEEHTFTNTNGKGCIAGYGIATNPTDYGALNGAVGTEQVYTITT